MRVMAKNRFLVFKVIRQGHDLDLDNFSLVVFLFRRHTYTEKNEGRVFIRLADIRGTHTHTHTHTKSIAYSTRHTHTTAHMRAHAPTPKALTLLTP